MVITFEKLPEAVGNLQETVNDIKRLLLERSDQSLKPEADQLLTIQQAAEFLNLSVPTLYGYVHNAEIPVCKKSKRLYFSKQELTDWIKTGRKKTTTEIAAEADTYLRPKKKGGSKMIAGSQKTKAL